MDTSEASLNYQGESDLKIIGATTVQNLASMWRIMRAKDAKPGFVNGPTKPRKYA